MAIDAATQSFLANMAAAAPAGSPPLWEMSVSDARLASSGLRDLYGPGPELERVENHVLPGHDGGSFRVRALVPSKAPTGILVYFHGGGWVLDDIDGYDTLGRLIAQKSGATVVLVDYRKAPEHPFPTPVEDAWSALRWVGENREKFAGPGAPILVAGDSAGGNLAAVMTHRARDNDGPQISGQILVYPPTDHDLGRASYLEAENQTFLTTEFMGWFWDHYAAKEDRGNPEAAPLRAASLDNLPPALIITAEHDVLRDEGEAYAQRLSESGVTVTHLRWPGQMHAFFTLVNILPASGEAISLVAEHIREVASDARLETPA